MKKATRFLSGFKVYAPCNGVNGTISPYVTLSWRPMVPIRILYIMTSTHSPITPVPLELEMFHQIKNVISVNPTFFEYLLTVDADTTSLIL
jgi:hypothetical protein